MEDSQCEELIYDYLVKHEFIYYTALELFYLLGQSWSIDHVGWALEHMENAGIIKRCSVFSAKFRLNQ